MGYVLYYIADCTPSIRECDSLTISKVAEIDVGFPLQIWELRIAPDDETVFWSIVRLDGFLMLTGKLRASATEGYHVTDVRVLNAPRPEQEGTLEGYLMRTPLGGK